MQYATFNRLGNPTEVLMLEPLEAVALPPGHVRVDVMSAPIHNSDLLQILGMYGSTPSLPAVPGSEGVGRVAEVGVGVEQLAVGQTVLVTGIGTWSTQAVTPVQQLIPMPNNADLDQLSMLIANPGSALLMLEEFVELSEGDWIIQSAANSAVGSLVVQFAKLRGVKTINVVRRESVVTELETLGGDIVLLDGPDLNERIIAAIGDAQVKLALDAVGGDTFSRLVGALAPGATMVSYSTTSVEPVSIHPMDVIFRRIKLHGFWMTDWLARATPEARQKLLEELVGYVVSGKLHTNIDSVYPLSQLEQAVTRALEEGRNGKVILRPQS